MQERAELHKTIWKIANDLRGSVDGWEFKAYVLGSIFYRFISENMCDYIHQLMKDAGQPDFDYTTISDEMAENIRQKMVEDKGYFILPSQLFQNVVQRCAKDENLNETLSSIFRSIESSAVGTPSEEDSSVLTAHEPVADVAYAYEEAVIPDDVDFANIVDGVLQVTPDIEEEIAEVERGETVSMAEFKTMFAKWL